MPDVDATALWAALNEVARWVGGKRGQPSTEVLERLLKAGAAFDRQLRKTCKRCTVCGKLQDSQTLTYTADCQPESPPGFDTIVRQAGPSPFPGDRGSTTVRCPECGGWYQYEVDYEFLVPASEDYVTVRRLMVRPAVDALRDALTGGSRFPDRARQRLKELKAIVRRLSR